VHGPRGRTHDIPRTRPGRMTRAKRVEIEATSGHCISTGLFVSAPPVSCRPDATDEEAVDGFLRRPASSSHSYTRTRGVDHVFLVTSSQPSANANANGSPRTTGERVRTPLSPRSVFPVRIPRFCRRSRSSPCYTRARAVFVFPFDKIRSGLADDFARLGPRVGSLCHL